MRRVNEAIERERHPIPTIEEVLHDLNGSSVFSKLDLKWGFHQVGLEANHVVLQPSLHTEVFSSTRINVRNYLRA